MAIDTAVLHPSHTQAMKCCRSVARLHKLKFKCVCERERKRGGEIYWKLHGYESSDPVTCAVHEVGRTRACRPASRPAVLQCWWLAIDIATPRQRQEHLLVVRQEHLLRLHAAQLRQVVQVACRAAIASTHACTGRLQRQRQGAIDRWLALDSQLDCSSAACCADVSAAICTLARAAVQLQACMRASSKPYDLVADTIPK